jgi:hypothetical protein
MIESLSIRRDGSALINALALWNRLPSFGRKTDPTGQYLLDKMACNNGPRVSMLAHRVVLYHNVGRWAFSLEKEFVNLASQK